MVKQIVLKLLIATLGIGWLFFGLAASAHTTETVGSLSLLMHVEPGDRAIVGSPAVIHVSIADTAGKFLPEQCACLIVVARGGKTLAELPARPEPQGLRLKTVGAAYTFDSAGSYDISLRGQPQAGAAFAAFTGRFDTTVYPPSRSLPLLWLIVPAAVLVAMFGGVVIWLSLRGRVHK